MEQEYGNTATMEELARLRKENEDLRLELEDLRVDLERAESQHDILENVCFGLEQEHEKAHNLLREKTEELASALQNLKEAQRQLIQNEKMAALGQLIAGVAHEINTPMGAIKASVDNIMHSLNEVVLRYPIVMRDVPPDIHDLFFQLIQQSMEMKRHYSTREERQNRKTLEELFHSRNLEPADRFADTFVKIGVVEGVDRYYPILQKANGMELLEMGYHIARQNRNTENIRTATDRVSKIVFALKNFSHFEGEEEMASVSLQDGIETVLVIYHNQIKHGVELVRDFESVPPVVCHQDQMIQVWTNILHNAIQAMNGAGRITISLRHEGDRVIVRITDNGPGIPGEIMSRIFEPFFTTKPRGEGSGLGLDICRRIVEKHGGEIRVDSVPGNTTFAISLPLRSESVTI